MKTPENGAAGSSQPRPIIRWATAILLATVITAAGVTTAGYILLGEEGKQQTIPMPSDSAKSRHFPEIGHFQEYAKDWNGKSPSIRYKVHVRRPDSKPLKAQLLRLAPGMGWLASPVCCYGNILLTIPEKDMTEIERMVKQPAQWIQEKTAAGPPGARRQSTGSLVNVVVDIDSDHGIASLLVIGGLISVLCSTIMLGIVKFSKGEGDNHRAQTIGEQPGRQPPVTASARGGSARNAGEGRSGCQDPKEGER